MCFARDNAASGMARLLFPYHFTLSSQKHFTVGATLFLFHHFHLNLNPQRQTLVEMMASVWTADTGNAKVSLTRCLPTLIAGNSYMPPAITNVTNIYTHIYNALYRNKGGRRAERD